MCATGAGVDDIGFWWWRWCLIWVMGCGGSKVDDYPLVTLCRERKELIRAATEHRYALASAHISYFRSLRDVGDALRRFVDEELLIASTSPLDSPSPPRPAPSSPPSPKVSAWDFLNPFDSYDSVYPSYYSHSRYGSTAGSSPDSKEVREREGIPDLEDETEQEVTKKVYRNGKKPNDFVNKNSGEGEGTSRSLYQRALKRDRERKNRSVSKSHLCVILNPPNRVAGPHCLPMGHGTRDLKEVVKEIKDEFDCLRQHLVVGKRFQCCLRWASCLIRLEALYLKVGF